MTGALLLIALSVMVVGPRFGQWLAGQQKQQPPPKEARPPSLHCQLGGNVSANLLPWEFNTSLVMKGLPDIRVS